MKKVLARTRSFFDCEVTTHIVEKYGFSEIQAIQSFISSKTYQMFIDADLEIYTLSPLIVFDMWESEQVTGNPRNSQYIRTEL